LDRIDWFWIGRIGLATLNFFKQDYRIYKIFFAKAKKMDLQNSHKAPCETSWKNAVKHYENSVPHRGKEKTVGKTKNRCIAFKKDNTPTYKKKIMKCVLKFLLIFMV
jgi:CRISPR/Cas system CMR-associated protein Cmr5 small subunit